MRNIDLAADYVGRAKIRVEALDVLFDHRLSVAATRLAVVNNLSTTPPAPGRSEDSVDEHRDCIAERGGEICGLAAILFNYRQHVQAGRPHHKDSGMVLWCSRLGCTSK